jgi:heme exporter protein B
MILPLTIPVLIFGVSASYGAVTENAAFLSPLLMLAANTLIAAIIGPLAAGYALKISTD